MTEPEYQYGLRELPPVKLWQIINTYRDKIHELTKQSYIDEIDDLKKVIPEWYLTK